MKSGQRPLHRQRPLRRRLAIASAALALASVTLTPGGAVWAQYPDRPVKLIVPFSPGGGSDLTSRLISQRLPELLGKSVVVENRPGGASNIGTEAVARATPDGYTLLMVTLSTAVNASLFPKLSFNVLKDFEPISLFATVPLMVAVHPSFQAQSIGELIAMARAKPGALNYGSGGLGSANHVAGELFKFLTGTNIVHVPYKGGGPALADLMGGHVGVVFTTLTSTHELVRTGRLRALATTGTRRSAVVPELPTVAEAGVPGYAVEAWYGVAAPAGTPRAIVERLSADVARVVAQPEVREALRAQGAEGVGNTPDEFARYLRAEVDKWAKTVKAQGLRGE